jgi:hypothetical protein
MLLLPFVFFIAIALAIWFVVFSEATVRAKIIVGLLFALSFVLRFTRFAMAGFLLQIAVSIFVAIYLKVQAA